MNKQVMKTNSKNNRNNKQPVRRYGYLLEK